MNSSSPDKQTRVEPTLPAEEVTLAPSALSSIVEAIPPLTEPSLDGIHVPGYEILGVLGRGGMGVVYKARQVKLNRLVALKMILAGDHACEADHARFRTEAEAVACLQHPNIVQIYEVGEADGQPFFSLEFCGGGTLAARLNGTPWPAHRAASLIEMLARAVDFAHQAGIVHRDLKPANILLSPPRRPGSSAEINISELFAAKPDMADYDIPKITDFGVAKRLDDANAKTVTGAVVGTPSYMAPEQSGGTGQEVGPAADTYALGAILYELLTGRPPFKGATPIDTIMQVVADDPISPRRVHPRIPRDLETICLKCLRKQPRKRYESAAALADDLKRFLNCEPIRARPTPFWERGIKWARRRPFSAALAGLWILAILGVARVAWLAEEMAVEERRSNQATGLVQSLSSIKTGALPQLINQMEPLRSYTDPQLTALATDLNKTPEIRLRAYLALADVDEKQIEYLSWRLLDCSFREFPLVRDRLKATASKMIPELFELLHDTDEIPSARFRAGLALVDYAPTDPSWTNTDFTFLATQLLQASRDEQRDLRDYLRTFTHHLLTPLETAFHDEMACIAVRLAAADALADLARDDASRLARLASEASTMLYAPLRDALLKLDDIPAAVVVLKGLIHESPARNLDTTGRINAARRRAGAAISLLLLGDSASACEVLQVRDDPEAATQFIHGLRERGVGVRDVCACLKNKMDTDVLFGLLLALGEFRYDELSRSKRDELRSALIAWHRDDPRSAIHAASGWLLRTWGFKQEANQIDQTPKPYDATGQREWFVERIGGDCFTFIVFRSGEFIAGSPPGEPFRGSDEEQYKARITHSFAICDRELTSSQYARFAAATKRMPASGKASNAPALAASDLTRTEAILYCRWLTTAAGLPEEQQCYDDPNPSEQAHKILLQNAAFYQEHTGFRLPTEVEWEYACRAGTTTAYSFGNDWSLLSFYGRFLQDSNIANGQLRPNRRGLFDMHGNAREWCQDWYRKQPTATDNLGDHHSTLRGGSRDSSPGHCRSASRCNAAPDDRSTHAGLRLVRTLP